LGTGNPGTGNITPLPVAVAPASGHKTMSYDQLAIASSVTCGLMAGQVYCWGSGSSGLLGQGESYSTAERPMLVPNLEDVTQLAAGSYSLCALTTSGEVYCWGQNNYGQVGNGEIDIINYQGVWSPTLVGGALTGKAVTILGSGAYHVCAAVGSSQEIYCWGQNSYGQLGIGVIDSNPNVAYSVPNLVWHSGEMGSVVTALALSQSHSCALTAAGEAWCWGGSYYNGVLGNLTYQNWLWPKKVAVDVTVPAGVKFVSLAAGESNTCAGGDDGEQYCWGQNNYGQLGSLVEGNQIYLPRRLAFLSASVGGRGCVSLREAGGDLVCVTPPGRAGSSEIVVENLGQVEKYPAVYDYIAGSMTVTGATPDEGGTGGGETLTVTGENLRTQGEARLLGSRGSHTCGVFGDELYCWGNNSSGQLGDGTLVNRGLPTLVAGSDGSGGKFSGAEIEAIAAGGSHTCVLAAGRVWCWGNNGQGQLGVGQTSAQLTISLAALEVTGDWSGTVTDLAAGQDFTCAVAGGELWCWGNNSQGQLGLGETGVSLVTAPVRAAGGLSGVEKVVVGMQFACALTEGGAVWCWGNNQYGQVGNGSVDNAQPPQGVRTPNLVGGALTSKNVRHLAVGQYHVCALVTGEADQVYCWGQNQSGQAGENMQQYPANITVPTLYPDSGVLAGQTLVELTAAYNYTCARSDTGALWCWGYGFPREGVTNQNTTYVPWRMSVPVAKGLVSGSSHTCVLDELGELWCWGSLSYGILGNNPNPYVLGTSPQIVKAYPAWRAAKVTVGGRGCETQAWTGASVGASLGESLACVVPAGEGLVDVSVSEAGDGGGSATLPAAWQYLAPFTLEPDRGMINGGTLVTVTDSEEKLTAVSGVSVVAAGSASSCGLYAGQVYCWGRGNYGQLGNGSVADSLSLVAVGGDLAGQTVTGLAGGQDHFCAIAGEGAAWCWGYNAYGQGGSGLGTIWGGSFSTTPRKVAGLPAGMVEGLAAGANHTCALVGGEVWCWGQNNYGQLALSSSTLTQSNTALKVEFGGATVTALAAGANHTCAVVAGSVWCWGHNAYGQLGAGGSESSNYVPQLVGGGLVGVTVVELASKSNHTCALTDGGEIYCWGNNSNGQLGDGSHDLARAPVLVDVSALPTLGQFTSLAVSGAGSCAFGDDGFLYCWGRSGGGDRDDLTPEMMNLSGVAAGEALVGVVGGNEHWCSVSEVGGVGGVPGSGSEAGALYCWGANNYGQLGTNQRGSDPTMNPTVAGVPYSVSLGGAGCLIDTIDLNDTLTCTSSEHEEAVVGVAVGQLGVWRRQAAAFTYFDVPAEIIGIEPARGPVAGGYLVTITGTGFHKRPSVMIGETACNEIDYVSTTELTCMTPAGAGAGAVDVSLDTPTQEPSVLTGGYEYYLPFRVDEVAPGWGMAAGGETVTVVGENFLPGVNYQVTLGEATCSGALVGDGGTSLTCTTGAYELSEGLTEELVGAVVTDGVMSAGLPAAYEYIGEIYLRLERSSEKVSFHLMPGKDGAVSSLAHQVTVSTNSHAGYQLSLTAVSDVTALVGSASGQLIAASTGTVAAPLKLARNTWGFAWAGSDPNLPSSGFDATYAPEANSLNSTSVWAGLPPAATPITIRTSPAQCKSGDTSEIFYAANADFTLPHDTYQQIILYTAIEN
jgi:alpha-tubulin suppressor-like RCC1 family protein